MLNITNKKFNHLTAIKFIEFRGDYDSYWLFKCACNNQTEKIIRAKDVRYGKVKSCGCLYKKPKTHGLSNHRLYKIWKAIKYRCLNKKCHNYNSYGGRGIKICYDWHSNFKI